MCPRLIAFYSNGNYAVKLYSDGTKIKTTAADRFIADFPDSIDLKITNYCDMGCPMCHERSDESGAHAELDAPFLDTLRAGTELAIGGGNPLSHGGLSEFLLKMKIRGVVCNLTVNAEHLRKSEAYVRELLDSGLIFGLGVSLSRYDEYVIDFARKNTSVVLHIINGVFSDIDKLFDKNLKVLILGYKSYGRGAEYFSPAVEAKMIRLRERIADVLGKFDYISFDNLALEQLNIKNVLPERMFNEMFFGEDGEASMYIDLVKREFARSSTSTERYPLSDNITDMFECIRIK